MLEFWMLPLWSNVNVFLRLLVFEECIFSYIIGGILNRFSKDIAILDDLLPLTIFDFIQVCKNKYCVFAFVILFKIFRKRSKWVFALFYLLESWSPIVWIWSISKVGKVSIILVNSMEVRILYLTQIQGNSVFRYNNHLVGSDLRVRTDHLPPNLCP